MTQPKLQVKNCDLFYGDFQALKNINLSIAEKEITAFIGPSGCGKSTLLKSLNRMNDLVEGCKITGDFTLDGENIYKDMEITELRKRVGMVFQKPNLFPMSIYDNIAYGPRTHGIKKKADLDEIVETTLRQASVWDETKDRLKKSALGMSGGQQQRICIARALAVKPEVLLMDEPTSALDPKTTKQILSLLQDLNKKLGLTVVMITHEMQIVKDICNRVAVMQNGQLLEEGSVLDIFSNPQEDLTQEFIETAAGIEDALAKINAQPLVKNLPSSALLVQLKYAGSSTDEPLLTELFKEYGVSSNILYGNVEILGDTPVGELVVVLDGEADQVLAAQKAIENAGVSLQVLKKGAQ